MNNQMAQLKEVMQAPARRILVVEDDVFLRGCNADVLVRSGYEVDTAEDGAAAWEALQVNSHNLLITDNNMPRLSGVELVKKMRTAHMTLPAVLASGLMPKKELARYPWLQFAATLQKPFTGDTLVSTVMLVLLAAETAGARGPNTEENLLAPLALSKNGDPRADASQHNKSAGCEEKKTGDSSNAAKPFLVMG